MEHTALISKEAQRCPYNPGNLTRTLTGVDLIVSVVFGITRIVFGELIWSHALPVSAEMYSSGNLLLSLDPPFIRELLLLLLNLTFVKISVWSSGTVHETALKWKLASENDRQTEHMRLEFNANLRFLQSLYEWRSADGLPANVIMALCLAIPYASSSMVLMSMEQLDGAYYVIVPFVALYVLGFATLLQSAIAFYAIYTTDIQTWSQSPSDTAAVLVNEGRLKRTPGRCMHSLFDRFKHGPVKPRERQESAWASHPQFCTFVMYIWMLVAAGYYWGCLLWGMMDSGTHVLNRAVIGASFHQLHRTALPRHQRSSLQDW